MSSLLRVNLIPAMTGYGHTEFLKSLVTIYNPQEHAKNSYIKLHARVSYTS